RGSRRVGHPSAVPEPRRGERGPPEAREPPRARPRRSPVPYEKDPELTHNPAILPRSARISGGWFAGQDDTSLAGEVRREPDILLDPEGAEEAVRGPEVRHDRLLVSLKARQPGQLDVGP